MMIGILVIGISRKCGKGHLIPDNVVVLSEVFNLRKHQFQRDEPENLCIRVGLVIDVIHDVEDMSNVEHEGLIPPRLEGLGGGI